MTTKRIGFKSGDNTDLAHKWFKHCISTFSVSSLVVEDELIDVAKKMFGPKRGRVIINRMKERAKR